MKVQRTYTLPNREKVASLTKEQETQIAFDKSKGSWLKNFEEDATLKEPFDQVIEINTNFDGEITIYIPKSK